MKTKAEFISEEMNQIHLSGVLDPIDGKPDGRSLLSINQLTEADIRMYLQEANSAEQVLYNWGENGTNLLPRKSLRPIMMQDSTRTSMSMSAAMVKLGGSVDILSGMKGSAEGKDESFPDTCIAFAATGSDIIGMRSEENYGPAYAAYRIEKAVRQGRLPHLVPVINLGDGTNEHPTQALTDMFTIQKHFHKFKGLTMGFVGDHERYRADHSAMMAAAKLGMNIVAVTCEAATVPEGIRNKIKRAHVRFEESSDLDEVMREVNVLYVERNPKEYEGNDPYEIQRTAKLKEFYSHCIIDYDRLQQMPEDSIVLHPRPRNEELHPSVDDDLGRMRDIEQMVNLTPMRMAIIARALGTVIFYTPDKELPRRKP